MKDDIDPQLTGMSCAKMGMMENVRFFVPVELKICKGATQEFSKLTEVTRWLKKLMKNAKGKGVRLILNSNRQIIYNRKVT